MSVKERWNAKHLINSSTQKLMSLVTPILKNDKRIIVSYLFGSRNSKNSNDDRDLDIAIYTNKDFNWDDYYSLHGTVTKLIHSDMLDLIWLNKSDSILNFNIISQGKVITYLNPDLLNDFELKAKKVFYDYSLYLNKHREK